MLLKPLDTFKICWCEEGSDKDQLTLQHPSCKLPLVNQAHNLQQKDVMDTKITICTK
jgi:hypothetical protein